MTQQMNYYYICNMPPQLKQDIFCPVIEGIAVVASGYGGAISFNRLC